MPRREEDGALAQPSFEIGSLEFTPHPPCSNGIPVVTLKRLMSAVSFGYGIFHLAVSLLPPKLLHLINAFGFEGDRQTGIQGRGSYSMGLKVKIHCN